MRANAFRHLSPSDLTIQGRIPVLTLLARQGTVSKEDLENHLYTLCEADKATFVDRAAMHGAIKALNGTPPVG
ncbi:hypothetical protein [Profundibacterium mesophilum]|uniref:Uncharacterized protein n=1 Tax=Profundibacterium mesophilum KAUST100406-0324 TaxID=1037889 RepID=A0A921NSB5_9RHOB|nr:hypothetical protein [Profundibacterium mesophilum]KAF0674455.1 hypothetical protein PMES_03238 [Profundibacterium mesophilum KAUST100406-0324]